MIANLHQWLSAFLLPTSLSEAREFLSLVRSSSQYLELYAHYFPATFKQSLWQNHGHWLIPLPGNAYTIFERQFLKLVDKHLFSLPEYVFDDPGEENRYYTVPIEPLGVPPLYEYEYEEVASDMDLGWQLLLYLGGKLNGEFFESVIGEDNPAMSIFDLEIKQGQVFNSALREVCASFPEPLCFFYLVVELLDHETGVAWLDATYDMPIDDAQWDQDTIDALKAQWAEAEEIWRKSTQFMRWLEEDVQQHFTEVVSLWNRCIQGSQRQIKPSE